MDKLKYVEHRSTNRFELPGISINSLISFKSSLSSGISQFSPPKLYTDCFFSEIKNGRFIKNYTLFNGHPTLTEALKYYEKLLAVEDFSIPDDFADKVCLTAGATPAIVFFYEYFSQKYPKSNILFLGLNYYLFYECLKRYDLNGITLTSREKGRIAPIVNEIEAVLEEVKPKLVVLSLPLNPSGEIYTEAELKQIIRLLKKHDILFLIDKCQLEEFASCFEFVNINKAVSEEGYFENTIIINSISKTRSLPGARLGYITANKEIMNYITYLNEIYYFNPPMVYITPFIIDLLFRIIYLKQNPNTAQTDIANIMKMFRNMIITTGGSEVYTEFFKGILKNPNINEEIDGFRNEINSNYKVIYNNYLYTKEKLGKHIYDITELRGGFNFCISLNKTSKKDQLKFCSDTSKAIQTIILPESFYNGHNIEVSEEPFWMRITAAYHHEEFVKLIDKLCLHMDNL